MSLFGNLFSSRTPDYPPLDGYSRAGKKVAEAQLSVDGDAGVERQGAGAAGKAKVRDRGAAAVVVDDLLHQRQARRIVVVDDLAHGRLTDRQRDAGTGVEIGRAACRERV